MLRIDFYRRDGEQAESRWIPETAILKADVFTFNISEKGYTIIQEFGNRNYRIHAGYPNGRMEISAE